MVPLQCVRGSMKEDKDYGRLTGLKYESSSGSMDYHSEFDIEVNAREIVYTTYYEDYCFGNSEDAADASKLAVLDGVGRVYPKEDEWVDEGLVERKHAAFPPELWQVLTEEFEYLKPELSECAETTREDIRRWERENEVLDGGDYSLLHLTWEKDGASYTAQFRIPSGRRWSTIPETLHEMVRPLGRDLRRIGERQLVEMYLSTTRYSYQITPVRGEASYYFFIHDDTYSGSKSKRLTPEQWYVVRDHLNTLDLSGVKQGAYSDRYYLRLTYNDHESGVYYRIDPETEDSIRAFILSLGY